MGTVRAVRRMRSMLGNYIETSPSVSQDKFGWEVLRSECTSRLGLDCIGRVSHNRLGVQMLDAVKDSKATTNKSSQFPGNLFEKTLSFRIIFRHCLRPLRKKPISIPIWKESTLPNN
jgi:hypothetical protein